MPDVFGSYSGEELADLFKKRAVPRLDTVVDATHDVYDWLVIAAAIDRLTADQVDGVMAGAGLAEQWFHEIRIAARRAKRKKEATTK